MNRLLLIAGFLLGLGVSTIDFPNGAIAVFFCAFFATITFYLIRWYKPGDNFLIDVFVLGLLIRVLMGAIIYAFKLELFFGNDATLYDALGNRLVEVWTGLPYPDDGLTERATNTRGSGWGMAYLTGGIYMITGRNQLAAQYFCAIVGAATAPMIYSCTDKIFNNRRVATTAALLIAVFPSFIVWSSQMLKDGLIVFLLVLSMTMVLELQNKLNYASVFILILALGGILTLRFYIFYMIGAAVVGSFVLGQAASAKAIVRGLVLFVVVGVALSYLGVLQNANNEFEQYGSLEKVQRSRSNLAESDSGFGQDQNVSTTEGAVIALPVGFTYLMLAPFPWSLTNFRQVITLPDVLLWYCCIPLLIMGLIYTVKNRLRNAVPILIFTVMLTIAYSVFQGNVGTAYRQRTQIQVFLFIFVAVGWTMIQEKRENRKAAIQAGLVKNARRVVYRND